MDVLTAVDSLDDLLHCSKPVPLTDDVRVDSGELERRVQDVRAAIPVELVRAGTSGMPALVDRLHVLVRDAKPVPLTKQVRVDREAVYSICDELRMSLPEDLREARESRSSLESPPVTSVSVEEATRSLSELLHKVRFGGQTIRITLNGTPMADLRPPAEPEKPSGE